jgi:hypothetical protein
VFPDSSLPIRTTGGLKNQEEFCKFVMENQNRKWEMEFTARPTSEKEADYKDDTFRYAFPLHFPYCFTGLSGDRAIIELKERWKQKQINLFQKLLQHRKPCFHYVLFNLNVKNLIMKDIVFLQTKIFCNVKSSDNTTMGSKYGTMTSAKLEKQFKIVNKTEQSSIPILQNINFYYQ